MQLAAKKWICMGLGFVAGTVLVYGLSVGGANEWGRLLWWSGQNSNAIQALSAIAIVGLTAALSGITLYYSRLTRRMAIAMEKQIEFSFQPNVATSITFRAAGESSSLGVRQEDSIYANVIVENKGSVPLKLDSLTMIVIFEKALFADASAIVGDASNLVLMPGSHKEFRLLANVPIDASRAKHHRRVILKCTDLTGLSKHTFEISDADSDVTHYLGFRDI